MPLDTIASQDTYSAPTSSPDPYASPTDTYPSSPTSRPPLPAHIDLNSLPSGLPLFGPLTGYSPTNLARLIHSRYAHLSQTLSRPLSEKELTAIAYHTAKGHAIASWGPSLGIAAGFYRWWATREEFRWPFYGALKTEEVGKGNGLSWDGEALRIGEKEVLKQVSSGNKASLLHILRGTSYGAIGLLVVPMAVSAYGATVTAVGEVRDARLSAVTHELRKAADKELIERGERRGEIREERIGQTTGQGRRDMGTVFRERRERLEGKGGGKRDEDDDMSPTGGGIGFGDDDEQGRLGGIGDMSGILSDGQMQQREVQAQPEAKRSPTENRASTFQIGKVARQPKNFGDDFDDASPTGGSGAGDAGGGSVWERIRQQSASGPSSVSEPSSRGRGRGVRSEQQEGSTPGDIFSFSSSEEERNYAKDEAQKEFDERVEKERRGGDFSDGRRW